VGKSPFESSALDTMTLRETVLTFALSPLTFEPGSKWSYCNPGITTLGRLIEVASGKSYADFMQERLFDPLGMKDTTFWPSDEQIARLATGYQATPDRQGIDPTPLAAFTPPLSNRKRAPFPGGGLFSTAADLAKFCQMILNGGTLDGRKYLAPEKVRQMTSRQTAESIVESYGFGWTTNGGMIAHGGAWKTNMTLHPKAGLITIFLVQVAGWRDDAEGKKIGWRDGVRAVVCIARYSPIGRRLRGAA
jgi:CubicO group peptidase (beta-lactamase class C family)